MGRYIDEDPSEILRFAFGGDGIEEEMLEPVRFRSAQFFDTAITSQTRGIAHNLAQPVMIRMLVRRHAGGQNNCRPKSAEKACDGKRVCWAGFEAAIPVEFEKLGSGAQKLRRLFRFTGSFSRGAVRARLAARTNDKVSAAPGASRLNDNAAATKLDIIRMCAKGEYRGGSGAHGMSV